MALVKDGDIFIVKDVFKFLDGESFENNTNSLLSKGLFILF